MQVVCTVLSGVITTVLSIQALLACAVPFLASTFDVVHSPFFQVVSWRLGAIALIGLLTLWFKVSLFKLFSPGFWWGHGQPHILASSHSCCDNIRQYAMANGTCVYCVKISSKWTIPVWLSDCNCWSSLLVHHVIITDLIRIKQWSSCWIEYQQAVDNSQTCLASGVPCVLSLSRTLRWQVISSWHEILGHWWLYLSRM